MIGLGFRPTDEDISGDIDRLIRSIVSSSTDLTNINLHFDEMYGEMMLKVAQLLNRQELFFENRKKFFGFLKVALTRHKNTLIQRYVFTEKRTGIKSKDGDHEMNHAQLDHHEHDPHQDDPHKPVKISLDDDENGVSNFFGVDSGRDDADTLEVLQHFINEHLTPLEALVIRQEIEPNDAAYTYAFVEHNIDQDVGGGKFKIRDIHKAQGIGLEVGAYKKALARVRAKMEPLFKNKTMNENNELQQMRLAELQLCQIFNIQVPGHVDPVIKRRCFTIAARDNFDKVTGEVASLLEMVGAYVPKKHGDTMACFGVLWEENHRSCTLCALEQSCKSAATQVGVDKIRIDKKLLGTKATKTPMILPKIEPPIDDEKPKSIANMTVLAGTDRDEEIMSFLNESMIPTLYEGEIFYRLPDKAGKRIFCVGQPERLMQLRFCNPSEDLKAELVPQGRGPTWTVPDDMELADVKALMNAHIANQLK